jgi:hypothetical protein
MISLLDKISTYFDIQMLDGILSLMIRMSGNATLQSCQVPVSTIFVFDNQQVQNAANTVYEYKKAYDARQSTIGSQAKYQFKSDFERMQYLTGLYGRFSQGLR